MKMLSVVVLTNESWLDIVTWVPDDTGFSATILLVTVPFRVVVSEL